MLAGYKRSDNPLKFYIGFSLVLAILQAVAASFAFKAPLFDRPGAAAYYSGLSPADQIELNSLLSCQLADNCDVPIISNQQSQNTFMGVVLYVTLAIYAIGIPSALSLLFAIRKSEALDYKEGRKSRLIF